MVLQKWNTKKRKYEDYMIPNNWKVKTYSTDMNEKINCASCGKEIKFGNCYTSLEIHTSVGFGFAVCENCYNEEFKRRIMEEK